MILFLFHCLYLFVVYFLFILANKESLSKSLLLFFLLLLLDNSHYNREELIRTRFSSFGPFPPTKCREQIHVPFAILSIVKSFNHIHLSTFFLSLLTEIAYFISFPLCDSIFHFSVFSKVNKVCSHYSTFRIT